MKKMSTLVMSSLLLTLASCGGKSSSSDAPEKSKLLMAESGVYEARLQSLNEHLAGDVHGRMQLKVVGDDFNIQVRVNGAPANTTHYQAIHTSDVCPTISLDENKDGVIDGVEATKSVGEVAIPLNVENKSFPTSDASGNYNYAQNRSVSSLMNSLQLKSGFRFQGKQIVVYGVPATVEIPETVNANFGLSKHAAIPIACGTIMKVSDNTNYNGGKY